MRSVNTKSLMVLAVAASCGYAGAATITHNPLTTTIPYSLEGAGNTGATAAKVNLNNVVVTMGAFQTKDSIIQLKLSSGRFFSAGASSPSVSCSDGNLVLDVGTPGANSATWDFGISATSGTTSNVVCTFASMAVQRSSLTSAGTVTIESGVKQTSSSTYSYDTSTAVHVLTVQSQIVSVGISTAFNGVVDYQSKQGYGFVSNDGTYGDQLGVKVTTRDTALSFTNALSIGFTISAESGKTFSFLDAEACGVSGKTPEISSQRSTALGYAAATGQSTLVAFTINPACTAITYVGTKAMTHDTAGHTFTIELGHRQATPSQGIVIEPMTFPAIVQNVTNGSVVSATKSESAGSWTSNGATVVIPYMPINLSAGTSAIDPVVTIANRSQLVGTLTGTMRDEDGNACTLDNLGSVQATRTKNLGGLIKTAFAACSNLSQTSTERMYITITATLPDSTTTFYSGFTVGGTSRVSVVNSTNGK